MAKTVKSRTDKLRERRKAFESNSKGDFNLIIFKEGIKRLRHLPVPDNDEPGIEVITFFLGNDIKGVISPATFGEPCAIMEKYVELKESSDSDDQALSKTFKPRNKYLVPSIQFKDEKGTEVDEQTGVKLANLASGQYQDLIDLFLDEEQGDFTDPISGYDIKYKRVGKGMLDTEYSMVPCKPTKLPKKYNKIWDPKEMVEKIMPSYEDTQDLIKRFLKLEDEEEEPIRKKKKKIRSEPEAPIKKKKKKIVR